MCILLFNQLLSCCEAERGCEQCSRNRLQGEMSQFIGPIWKITSLHLLQKRAVISSSSHSSLALSQLCAACNHSVGAIILLPDLQGACSSPETQGSCRQSFSAFSPTCKDTALWGPGDLSPSAEIKGLLRIYFLTLQAGRSGIHS